MTSRQHSKLEIKTIHGYIIRKGTGEVQGRGSQYPCIRNTLPTWGGSFSTALRILTEGGSREGGKLYRIIRIRYENYIYFPPNLPEDKFVQRPGIKQILKQPPRCLYYSESNCDVTAPLMANVGRLFLSPNINNIVLVPVFLTEQALFN